MEFRVVLFRSGSAGPDLDWGAASAARAEAVCPRETEQCAHRARRSARRRPLRLRPRGTMCRGRANYDTLAQRLREMAFLNKGLEITLTDERTADAKTGEARRAEFKYAGGIAEFV